MESDSEGEREAFSGSGAISTGRRLGAVKEDSESSSPFKGMDTRFLEVDLRRDRLPPLGALGKGLPRRVTFLSAFNRFSVSFDFACR